MSDKKCFCIECDTEKVCDTPSLSCEDCGQEGYPRGTDYKWECPQCGMELVPNDQEIMKEGKR